MKKKYSKTKSKNYIHLIHPYEPIFNSESKILILGTIPSISSRENGFFYMHNKNRFWPIMQTIFNVKFKYKNNEGKNAINERKNFLINNKIALWDVIHSCDIISSDDNSIKNVQVNDFKQVFLNSQIQCVFCTGNKAFKTYEKYCKGLYDKKCFCLPSTSPANQINFPFDKICEIYKENICKFINVENKSDDNKNDNKNDYKNDDNKNDDNNNNKNDDNNNDNKNDDNNKNDNKNDDINDNNKNDNNNNKNDDEKNENKNNNNIK